MIADLTPYPEYKASELPWMGQVPSHWEISPFSGVARLKSVVNQTHRELLSVYLQRGVVKFSDVDEKRTNSTSEDLSRYQAVDPGDFVLNNQQAWRGSVGVSAFSGIVSPAYLVLSLTQRYLPQYANFLFRDQYMVSQYLICSKGVGTIQRNLYWPQLKRVGVPLPPPSEQATIVRFLDWANGRLERAIRAKRKVIALLQEQKQAIIHKAVTQGLDPNVPKRDSGIPWLREIPAHWEVRRLRFCINGKLNYGANEAAEFDNPDWPRYLRITDFSADGTLKSDTFRSLPPHIAKDYSVQDGDILFARSGATVGKAFLVRKDTANACYAGYLIRARPRPEIMLPDFLFAFTQSLAFTRWKDEIFSKATIQNIGADKYSNLVIPIPEVTEQKSILARVSLETQPLSTAIDRYEREITLLREYRTRLVADVVTGKLDVREAALLLPEEAVGQVPEGAVDEAEEPELEEFEV
jgi:type I restriction enzyme S subunit